MSNVGSRCETDQRDVGNAEQPPMPQHWRLLGPWTESQEDVRSDNNTPPSPKTPPIFEMPRRKPVVESHIDLSQHINGSHTRKLSSNVYNTVPVNDIQQEATSIDHPTYNASAYFLLITDWWLLEIVSFVISMASLMATIIILAKYEGKPIYNWPYKITLNTVIAVLATVAQVSLMVPVTSSVSQLKWLWFNEKPRPLVDFETIDSASRGPWGSLLLLGRLRSLHWASLGAVTSILALTMPPFTQQLLSSGSVNTATTSASISSALNFTQYKGMRSPTWSGTVPQSMLAAIYNGILKSDITLSDVTPNCRTGNCSWPLYGSLGLCPSIANISSMVTVSCPADEDTNRCRYSVPGGAYLHNTDSTHLMNMTSFGELSSVNSTAMKDVSSVMGFYVIALNPISYEYIAYEASLQLCVQTLNSTVRDGRHTTTAVGHVGVPVNGYGWDPLSDNTTTVNGTVFTFSNPSTEALSYSLQDVFNGDISYVTESTLSSTVAVGVIWEALFVSANNTVLDTPNPRGFEKFLSSFAASISNAMRTPVSGKGDDDTRSIIGAGNSNVSFVRVHWPWLIPLVIITILAAILLVATIMLSSRRGIKIWKSSSIAVLAALQNTTRSEVGKLEKVTSMDNRSKDVHVILDTDSKGLKLFKEEKSTLPL
ncbi:hypothetical protein V492_05157 [Pseudogymnoascus sp. VKM F-4246]|nr:hypothetical protein V492_05157 [Pseudogymnoascus sp. VKM F-4246]